MLDSVINMLRTFASCELATEAQRARADYLAKRLSGEDPFAFLRELVCLRG